MHFSKVGWCQFWWGSGLSGESHTNDLQLKDQSLRFLVLLVGLLAETNQVGFVLEFNKGNVKSVHWDQTCWTSAIMNHQKCYRESVTFYTDADDEYLAVVRM